MEEAKEYAWWLDQFREVAFDGGLPTTIPEPAALMPLAVGGAVGMAPLYQIGIHRPATQKQRQQIAEADAKLYEYQVGIGQGYDSALSKMNLDEEEKGKVDTAILNYPLSANTLNSIASEKKVRAFSQWVAGPNRTSNALISLNVEKASHPNFMGKVPPINVH